jgi:hypothetical protein
VDPRAEVLSAGPRDHIVLFYRNDAELVQAVGEYLLAAIRGGGAAIVIGDWEHRLPLGRLLVRAGIDLVAARVSGAYCDLDASDTIGKFVVDSHADAAGFWAEITPAIRRAAGIGQPVRIFGEMVAPLWDAGLAGAAIEVEAMWNELAAQFPFSLICGCPVDSVADGPDFDPLAQMCRAHSGVAGAPPAPSQGRSQG